MIGIRTNLIVVNRQKLTERPQLLKKVNLLTICNLLENNEGKILDLDTQKFLGIEGSKSHEIPLIIALCREFQNFEDYQHLCRDYYLNYKIPQIGKEFDILRIGSESIVNVELKSEVNEGKIFDQLRRNSYYLSFLGKAVSCFTFARNGSEYLIYKYVESEKRIILMDSGILAEKIIDLVDINNIQIDKFFEPSRYLISPFNDVDRFASGQYFLTGHQEEIKNKILKKISLNQKCSVWFLLRERKD